jgi:hypothetical protein
MIEKIKKAMMYVLESRVGEDPDGQGAAKEEKKYWLAIVSEKLKERIETGKWDSLPTEKSNSKLGYEIIEFWNSCRAKDDLVSVQKVLHFLKIDASTDEILECIRMCSIEPVAGGNATR